MTAPFHKVGLFKKVLDVHWGGAGIIVLVVTDEYYTTTPHDAGVELRDFTENVLDNIGNIWLQQIKVPNPQTGSEPLIEQTITPEMMSYYYMWSYEPYLYSNDFNVESERIENLGPMLCESLNFGSWEDLVAAYEDRFHSDPPNMTLYDDPFGWVATFAPYWQIINHQVVFILSFEEAVAIHDSTWAPTNSEEVDHLWYNAMSSAGEVVNFTTTYYTGTRRTVIFINVAKVKEKLFSENPGRPFDYLEFSLSLEDGFETEASTFKGETHFPVDGENLESPDWSSIKRKAIEAGVGTSFLIKVIFDDLSIFMDVDGGTQ